MMGSTVSKWHSQSTYSQHVSSLITSHLPALIPCNAGTATQSVVTSGTPDGRNVTWTSGKALLLKDRLHAVCPRVASLGKAVNETTHIVTLPHGLHGPTACTAWPSHAAKMVTAAALRCK